MLLDRRRAAAAIRVGLRVAFLSAWLAHAGYAQQDSARVCPHGRISRVVVHNHSIFDVHDAADSGRVPWIYRVADAIHMKTKASFIRRELLVKPGDCFDPLLLEESGRMLRQYRFIARADVSAVDLPNGTKEVVADTQDDWTTQVDLGVSLDSGLRLEVLDVSEENLLGRGILASAFIRQRNEQRDVGGRLGVPHLFGTRVYGSLDGGRTRVGTFLDQAFTYPFVGEVGKVSFGESYLRNDELFPYSTGQTASYGHLLLPLLDERLEARAAFRVGRPGDLTTFGLSLSRKRLDFSGFPDNVKIAEGDNYARIDSAPSGAATALSGQTHGRSTTSIDLLLGQRNVHFRRVRGLDALDGETDVRLGTEVQGRLGRSVDASSRPMSNGADAIETGLKLYGAGGVGRSLLFAEGRVQGRKILSGGVDGDGWHDIIGEIDLYGYVRSHHLPHQTLFARMSGAGGWSMDTPFQLTLGGRTSVRGLRLADFPGARRLIVTVEDRVFMPWPAPDLFDAGFTVFGDLGRTWSGDVPFGFGSGGWRGTLGFGLRFGFPSGTRNLLRADLAFPVGMGAGRGPVFRVSLRELLGLTAGFADPQLERSRR